MKAIWLILPLITFISCSNVNFAQKGFYRFSSSDMVLITFDQFPDDVAKTALEIASERVSCPVLYYAESRTIDAKLYRNGIILANVDRADSISLSRIQSILNVSHWLDCIPVESPINKQIQLYPNSTNNNPVGTKNYWTNIEFNVYDLSRGKLIWQVTSIVTSNTASFEKKSGDEVVRFKTQSSHSMFRKGIKKGLNKLFVNCK